MYWFFVSTYSETFDVILCKELKHFFFFAFH